LSLIAVAGSCIVSSPSFRQPERGHLALLQLRTEILEAGRCNPESQRLNFSKAVVLQNNLGGFSGDGPAELRFGSVATANGSDVDMVVTSLSKYWPHNMDRNRLIKPVGAINVHANSRVTLEVSFLNATSGEAVEMDPFYFSLHDFSTTSGRQILIAENFDEYNMDGSDRITVMQEQGMAVFTTVPNKKNEPAQLAPRSHMTKILSGRSITLLYPKTSSFNLTLSVVGGIAGRNFFFSGLSNTCSPKSRIL